MGSASLILNQISKDNIVDCPTEADWYPHWVDLHSRFGESDFDLALMGGASADRIAWVFMSGYQAAVRHSFPEFSAAGWSCFAVAEPKGGPTCQLAEHQGEVLLSGQKSWIAGAGHIDRLVVSVAPRGEEKFLLVERRTPGVAISLPRTPSFLAELTQGAAAFDQVRIESGGLIIEQQRAFRFRAAEPLFVLLALNACLVAHADEVDGSEVRVAGLRALSVGEDLLAQTDQRELIKPGLGELRSLTADVVGLFSESLSRVRPAMQKSWQVDGRLLEQFGVLGRQPLAST